MSAVTIALNQEVAANPHYVTSEGGEFGETDFVLCQHKSESTPKTCAFLTASVVGVDPEN